MTPEAKRNRALARDITARCCRGQVLFIWPLRGNSLRITRARSKKGQLQCKALWNGRWYTIGPLFGWEGRPPEGGAQ